MAPEAEHEVAELLRDPTRRRSPAELSEIPTQSGVYAWWVGDGFVAGEMGLSSDGATHPIYIGVARKSLQKRITQHLLPIHQGRSEFHSGFGEWLAMLSCVPWTPSIYLQVERYGEDRAHYQWAEHAIGEWMRLGLTVSWVSLSTEAEAQAAEGPAIRELKPLFNTGMKARIWGSDRTSLLRPDVDRDIGVFLRTSAAVLWAQQHSEQILGIGEDDEVWVHDDEGFLEGDVQTPGTLSEEGGALPSELLAHSREILCEWRSPYQWYSLPWRQLYGDPPTWEAIIDEMSELERRSLVLGAFYGSWFPANEGLAEETFSGDQATKTPSDP